jgi:hypothetical protein
MQMEKLTSTSLSQEKPVGSGDTGISPAELYLKTFDELKKEIAASVTDARSTERNTLLLCGGIIAYISAHCGTQAIVVARYLPVVLAVFGAFRVSVLMLSVNPQGHSFSKCRRSAKALYISSIILRKTPQNEHLLATDGCTRGNPCSQRRLRVKELLDHRKRQPRLIYQ